LSFLKEHPYYLWIRWTGNILFSVDIVWIPFTKETDKNMKILSRSYPPSSKPSSSRSEPSAFFATNTPTIP
jgi:hypothetical protein